MLLLDDIIAGIERQPGAGMTCEGFTLRLRGTASDFNMTRNYMHLRDVDEGWDITFDDRTRFTARRVDGALPPTAFARADMRGAYVWSPDSGDEAGRLVLKFAAEAARAWPLVLDMVPRVDDGACATNWGPLSYAFEPFMPCRAGALRASIRRNIASPWPLEAPLYRVSM